MPNQQQPDTGKRHVCIRLDSRNGSERVTRQMEGELYPKGRCIYLRYQELPEAGMGRTFTTIRIEPPQLRIVRQGDIMHEQTFQEGERHVGYIQTPHGRLEMETVTKSVEFQLGDAPDSPLVILWSYELTVMGEAAGDYRIEISAVPSGDAQNLI